MYDKQGGNSCGRNFFEIQVFSWLFFSSIEIWRSDFGSWVARAAGDCIERRTHESHEEDLGVCRKGTVFVRASAAIVTAAVAD